MKLLLITKQWGNASRIHSSSITSIFQQKVQLSPKMKSVRLLVWIPYEFLTLLQIIKSLEKFITYLAIGFLDLTDKCPNVLYSLDQETSKQDSASCWSLSSPWVKSAISANNIMSLWRQVNTYLLLPIPHKFKHPFPVLLIVSLPEIYMRKLLQR